jgi:hypothetical protein
MSCLPKRAGSAPGAAVARHLEHGVEKEPVIGTDAAYIAGFARQMGAKAAHAQSLISSKLLTNAKIIVHTT